VFIVVSAHFVIDSVRKLLDTSLYSWKDIKTIHSESDFEDMNYPGIAHTGFVVTVMNL